MAQVEKLCTHPGCTKPLFVAKHGLCQAHYHRMRRGKDMDKPQRIYGTPRERFVQYFEYDPSGCWVWTGGKNEMGYGAFNANGFVMAAHRFAYREFIGPLPDHTTYEGHTRLVVDHLCGRRDCVNPLHLELVTHATNIRRAYAQKQGESR